MYTFTLKGYENWTHDPNTLEYDDEAAEWFRSKIAEKSGHEIELNEADGPNEIDGYQIHLDQWGQADDMYHEDGAEADAIDSLMEALEDLSRTGE